MTSFPRAFLKSTLPITCVVYFEVAFVFKLNKRSAIYLHLKMSQFLLKLVFTFEGFLVCNKYCLILVAGLIFKTSYQLEKTNSSSCKTFLLKTNYKLQFEKAQCNLNVVNREFPTIIGNIHCSKSDIS